MSIRFSKNGPEIPVPLLEALIAGDVVFVCGAGVSAPQLPGFGLLVEQTYAALDVQMDESEQLSFNEKRFEEALGSLARKLTNPEDLIDAVSGLLAVPENADLTHHETVLRLSRNPSNQVVLVTTNFDTLFERAAAKSPHPYTTPSASGQALPAPGGSDFHGIIHMHGRLEDVDLSLESTPLVLTSADYGDAYMRAGWASRFLFDLIRCKTIVLLGYAAGDAPVRYFLAVLSSDRTRFPDLKTVYAFHGVENEVGEADARWGALDVTPVPYTVEVDAEGDQDHSVLWRDLDSLAAVIERPKASRHGRAMTLLQRPPKDLSEDELKELDWLFSGKDDLWSLVVGQVADPAWFELLRTRSLWQDKDAAWVIADWIARDPQDRQRFEVGISWMERLGEPFARTLQQSLRRKADVSHLWYKAWRLLTLDPPSDVSVWDPGVYDLLDVLKRQAVLDRDLTEAVDWMTPRLVIERQEGAQYGEPPHDPPLRIHDICWPRLKVREKGEAPEFFQAFPRLGRPVRLMEIATASLASIILTARDAEMIIEEYDSVEAGLPSIEPSRQNDYRDGPVFLIQLLAAGLPDAVQADLPMTKAVVEQWRHWPGRLGIRMWLHAMRDESLFSTNEVFAGVAGLTDFDFWSVRRELALLLRDRAAQGDRDSVEALEARILRTAEDYFSRYEIAPGQTDWRLQARDSAVWLRLKMLDAAGKLSRAGKDALTAILQRNDYLDRDAQERDFFNSYSSGVTTVEPDPTPIVEASEDERLKVALETRQGRDYRQQLGWSTYVRSDPEGALRTLRKGELDVANAALWQEYVGALSSKEHAERDGQRRIDEVFEILRPAGDAFLDQVADRLVDLLLGCPVPALAGKGEWWDRLWAVVVARQGEGERGDRLHSRAINDAAGQLAVITLKVIDSARGRGEAPTAEWITRMRAAAGGAGISGHLARAVLVHDAGFVLAVDPDCATEFLVPAVDADDEQGAALRAVLCGEASLTKGMTRVFRTALLRGSIESKAAGRTRMVTASKLLVPVASVMSNDKPQDGWGISAVEAAQALRLGGPAVRAGAADWLNEILGTEADPAKAWRTWMAGMVQRVWPRERRLQNPAFTHSLAALAVSAGDAFPEALDQLRPYLSPAVGRISLYFLTESKAPEHHPAATLDLLWAVFGLGVVRDAIDLPNLLDRILTAAPALEVDRRFQSLEHRVVRYS